MSSGGENRRTPRQVARWVIDIEAMALRGLLDQLDERFDRAVEVLRQCSGRVICTGMGKSGLIMKKVAATMSSTGTPALFLHPAEAVHGDLGMIASGDVVLAASYSGTTEELMRLVEVVKRLAAPLIAITGKEGSPLAQHADIHLPVTIDKEACPLNLAPTASTTVTLALGDALAMALLEARGFTHEDFAQLHPGGQLGKKLRNVSQLMHHGNDLPQVGQDATMRQAIAEMSSKGLGITAVVDGDGRLVGCLTDGDLRRLLAALDGDRVSPSADGGEGGEDALGDDPVRQRMHTSPHTISPHVLASVALQQMEEKRITSLFVCDDEQRLLGIVHIHDLWRLELF